MWAILTLGRFFRFVVVIQEGHRIIDRGPYRFLRHPSYTGGLVATVEEHGRVTETASELLAAVGVRPLM
jgi:isoprenylcysteine carboxyl methyltransferase (ICMT) family protein YpbQ